MVSISLLQRISGYKTVSIIGMDKNAGKTTVLNHILDSGWGQLRFGLTSIGWDGEGLDQVTQTDKPYIYVEKGTIIATAKKCLSRGDATLEILNTTGINTPMGEVVIVRALSDGNVELAGPSTSSGISSVCSMLREYGACPVMVDGAISRKSPASPSVTEGVILSTGASLSGDMHRVVEETAHMVKLLTLKREPRQDVLKACRAVLKDSRAAVVQKDGKLRDVKIPTALESEYEITKHVDEDTAYIAVKGIVTGKFLDKLASSIDYPGITLLVEDGTRVFAGSDALYRFEKRGWGIRAMDYINLLCVTANPISPYGYDFDCKVFLERLRREIQLPVYDVIGGD